MQITLINPKYKLGGPNRDVIGLPVVISGLPERIEVFGHKLVPKSSFHISLVCIGKIVEKYGIQNPEFKNEVINDFNWFVENFEIRFLGYKNEFRFLAEGEKKAVVVMCEVSYLRQFFEEMNNKYSLNIEYPPTHITLYTLQPEVGIFMTNLEDMKNLSKQIPAPFDFNILRK